MGFETMVRVRRPATYDDLLLVPDTMVAEIIDGELVATPRPASPHALAASGVLSDLFGRFSGPPGNPNGPGGWWILTEPELHLGPDVVVPDLGGWRRARMPVLEDVPAFTLSPDWVCEVVSPKTARIDRVRKMRIYAREGIPHFWLVDPILESVESYRLDGERWVVASTHAGPETARIAPFDEVELDLARWWRATA